MELPKTLPAQLYLLAYDRQRRCFRFDRDNSRYARWRFGYAVRAAMLADLYLSGCIEDRGGKAYRSNAPRHDDPVLNDAVKNVAGQNWMELIGRGGSVATRVVREQLEGSGWIDTKQRRRFGIFPAAGIEIYDGDAVDNLADRVVEGLRNILDDLHADPRPLALGLIAVQAQLAPVYSFIEERQHRDRLHELTLLTIEPILGLHQAIVGRLEGEGSGAGGWGAGGWGAGGCGGGGCGGGV